MYIIPIIDDEEYRECTYPGVIRHRYFISNYGNIKNAEGYVFSQDHKYASDYRYRRVKLRTTRGPRQLSIHRLVAWEFCSGYDPESGSVMVNHLDGDTFNNYYENLEWCTQSENERHKYDHLGYKGHKPPTYRGEENPSSKHKNLEIERICELLEDGYGIIEIMNVFGYSGQTTNKKLYSLIYDIKNRRSWISVSKKYNF